MTDAGNEDAGLDAGRDAGVDAGLHLDAGALDAGPPPPRTVFGSMTVNGTPHMLSSGYGTQSTNNHQLRLGTSDLAQPQIQVTLVLPVSSGPGSSAVCGGSSGILFAARWIQDGAIAFFTLNPTCNVGLTQVATQIDEDYRGTFSGALDWEPRSVLDAGFPVMTITNGSYTVRRTF